MYLPRFIILRAYDGDASVKCCLSGENHTLGWPAGAAGSLVLQVSGVADASSTYLATPAIKFELEPAVIDNNLVHIRSCHNNKYWVRNSPDGHSIVAAAKEPQEDQSKWSCSLFKPNLHRNQNTIQFIHVQLGCDVSYETTINDSSALCLTSGRDYYTALFRFLDWETLVILPKYVAFKGDNGKYLKVYMERDVPYLQFAGTDLGDPQVGQRIFYRTDGSIMLKSYHFDQYWRFAEHEWILPDASDGSDKETWFFPVKVDTNVIALRSLANKKFCERQGGDGGDCLGASVSAITIESRMVVEEQVICRQVYHVRFRLSDARIYDQELLTLATGHVFNGSEESNRVEVKLSYVDSKSSTWCSGVSMNLGVKTFMESGIPFIEKQRVEVSNKLGRSYEWGQPIESSTEVEASYRVDVAANTEMRISLVATKGWCDVPFSYTQRDTLVDGRVIVTRKSDGVYTGSNCYNFMYHLLSPLPPPNPTWP